MEKLTTNKLRAIALHPDPPELVPPRPFPGKFPTRIAVFDITGTWLQGKLLYMGKPTRGLRKLPFPTRKGAQICVVEFDRKVVVWREYFLVASGKVTVLQSVWAHPRLFSVYHPWCDSGYSILDLFAEDWYPKRARGIAYYSRYQKLRKERLDEHLAFLTQIGVSPSADDEGS